MRREQPILDYLYRVVSGTEQGPLAGAVRLLLTGLEGLYRLLLGLNRALTRSRSLPVPVISVGNLVAGGTGKTPTVVWLVRWLRAGGRNPAILTRGYGGVAQKEGLVFCSAELSNLQPGLTGDEPYLLAKLLPGTRVAVGRDRLRMGQAALQDDPTIDCFVLDDGFQYWKLQRDYDIVVMDASNPFGNGRLIPRGILREPLSGLSRAQAVFLTRLERVDQVELERLTDRLIRENPELQVGLVEPLPPEIVKLSEWSDEPSPAAAVSFLEGRRCGAVTAIGNPQQFFDSLIGLGAELAFTKVYPDHHSWTPEEMESLIAELRETAITEIVVTAKDGVKLERFTELFQRAEIELLLLTLEFSVRNPQILSQIDARIQQKGWDS